MAYSEWQLNRLRNALRGYHAYGGRNLKQAFNWKDVAEAIAVALDLDEPPVAAERLRQFVEGVRSKESPGRKFGTLKPESLDAVVNFLTGAHLLLPAEIEEPAPSSHAAQRLLDYLDQKADRMRVLTPVIFDGTYRARIFDDRVCRVLELTLHHPSEKGMMQVTKTEEVFDKKLADRIDDWTPDERRGHCRKRTVYGGWAIFTPEDNIMVFLKEADNGKNLYQFTLAADWYAPDTEAERLFLLRHDYPIELEDANRDEQQIIHAILEETQKNVCVFRRVT